MNVYMTSGMMEYRLFCIVNVLFCEYWIYMCVCILEYIYIVQIAKGRNSHVFTLAMQYPTKPDLVFACLKCAFLLYLYHIDIHFFVYSNM